MSAGMAYEAMNNAGALDARLIVILNDNDMSIAPPVGRMSRLSGAAGFRSRPYPRAARCSASSSRAACPNRSTTAARETEEYRRAAC